MEGPAPTHYDRIKNTVRKRRSQTCRRPHPDPKVEFIANHDRSPLISSAPSDNISDDIPAFDTNPKRKQFSLSHCMSRAASISEYQRENHDSRRDNICSTQGVIATANWKNTIRELQCDGDVCNGKNGESLDLVEAVNEGKVKRVKLKLGSVTRTIHANGGTGDVLNGKSSRTVDGSRSRAEQNLQGNSDDCNSPQYKRIDLQGNPWKDISAGKEASSMGRMPGKNGKQQGESTGPVRKSQRVLKRRVLDGEFSEEDDDDEIRYLEKLKSNNYVVYKEDDEGLQKKQRKPSRVSTVKNAGSAESRSEDLDYNEEEELVSDNDFERNNKTKKRKQSVESPIENKREMTLTSRQRALLQSCKNSSSAAGSSLIEFPNGLTPAPPRKQKEKLSAVEQQLKKAEAAQKRKIQTEKAARESEAEAIRKILGQDSNRKKREEKMRKRREELAQEKAAHEQMVATSCIRTVMGPSGTTLTFPKDMGLPSIFDPKPLSYPPPREKCAGPSCTNPYKYRDSKRGLPLCSLRCYKAVQAQATS